MQHICEIPPTMEHTEERMTTHIWPSCRQEASLCTWWYAEVGSVNLMCLWFLHCARGFLWIRTSPTLLQTHIFQGVPKLLLVFSQSSNIYCIAKCQTMPDEISNFQEIHISTQSTGVSSIHGHFMQIRHYQQNPPP